MEFCSLSSRWRCACPRTSRSPGQPNRFRCSATRPVKTNAMCPLVVSSCSVKHAIVSLAPGCCCFVFPSAEQQRRTRCSSYSNNRFVVSVVKKRTSPFSSSFLSASSSLFHPHPHLHSFRVSSSMFSASLSQRVGSPRMSRQLQR